MADVCALCTTWKHMNLTFLNKELKTKTKCFEHLLLDFRFYSFPNSKVKISNRKRRSVSQPLQYMSHKIVLCPRLDSAKPQTSMRNQSFTCTTENSGTHFLLHYDARFYVSNLHNYCYKIVTVKVLVLYESTGTQRVPWLFNINLFMSPLLAHS